MKLLWLSYHEIILPTSFAAFYHDVCTLSSLQFTSANTYLLNYTMKNNRFLIIFLIHLCNTKCKTCEIKAKSPCIFPFIFENKTYNSCTKEGSKSDEFWCATYVNDTRHYANLWAKCKDFCAPNNMESEICDPIVEAPCMFPFKYKNNTYNSCTEATWTKFWCSTFVNDTNHHQEKH